MVNTVNPKIAPMTVLVHLKEFVKKKKENACVKKAGKVQIAHKKLVQINAQIMDYALKVLAFVQMDSMVTTAQKKIVLIIAIIMDIVKMVYVSVILDLPVKHASTNHVKMSVVSKVHVEKMEHVRVIKATLVMIVPFLIVLMIVMDTESV
jgi:hypothetical protein